MDMYPCKRCLDVLSRSQSQESVDQLSFSQSSLIIDQPVVVDLSCGSVESQNFKTPESNKKSRKRKQVSKDVDTSYVCVNGNPDRQIYFFMEDKKEISCPIEEFFKELCSDGYSAADNRLSLLRKNIIGLISVLSYYGDSGISKKNSLHARDKYCGLTAEYNKILANLSSKSEFNILFDMFGKYVKENCGRKDWPAFIKDFQQEKIEDMNEFTDNFKTAMGIDDTLVDGLSEQNQFLASCKFGEFIEKTAKEIHSAITNWMNVHWIDSSELKSGYTEACKYVYICILISLYVDFILSICNVMFRFMGWDS